MRSRLATHLNAAFALAILCVYMSMAHIFVGLALAAPFWRPAAWATVALAALAVAPQGTFYRREWLENAVIVSWRRYFSYTSVFDSADLRLKRRRRRRLRPPPRPPPRPCRPPRRGGGRTAAAPPPAPTGRGVVAVDGARTGRPRGGAAAAAARAAATAERRRRQRPVVAAVATAMFASRDQWRSAPRDRAPPCRPVQVWSRRRQTSATSASAIAQKLAPIDWRADGKPQYWLPSAHALTRRHYPPSFTAGVRHSPPQKQNQ